MSEGSEGERVNEVKINEAREHHHLQAVSSLHAPFIMYDLNKNQSNVPVLTGGKNRFTDYSPVFPWS